MAAPRGPGGRFLSKAEREALEAEGNTGNTITTEGDGTDVVTADSKESNMSATDVNTEVTETEDEDRYEIEFLDEGLPKINRKVESGVWVKRLAPLRERPGVWAKIFGPTNSPHAQVNNLRGGNAAGINPDEWQFAGRNLPTGETDEDGKPVKQGFVFAKFLTEDEKAERDAKRAEGEDPDAEEE